MIPHSEDISAMACKYILRQRSCAQVLGAMRPAWLLQLEVRGDFQRCRDSEMRSAGLGECHASSITAPLATSSTSQLWQEEEKDSQCAALQTWQAHTARAEEMARARSPMSRDTMKLAGSNVTNPNALARVDHVVVATDVWEEDGISRSSSTREGSAQSR